VDRSRL